MRRLRAAVAYCGTGTPASTACTRAAFGGRWPSRQQPTTSDADERQDLRPEHLCRGITRTMTDRSLYPSLQTSANEGQRRPWADCVAKVSCQPLDGLRSFFENRSRPPFDRSLRGSGGSDTPVLTQPTLQTLTQRTLLPCPVAGVRSVWRAVAGSGQWLRV